MISVIIPAYNAEQYLDRCLESVLNQTYREFELILIDDGSTDTTSIIAHRFSEADKRIRYIRKENGGSASARNMALTLAQGDYIAFVDADDYIHPCYLETLLNTLLKTNSDICQCDYLEVANNKIIKYASLPNNTVVNTYTNVEFLKQFCEKRTYLRTAVLWNKLYRIELFDGLTFPVGKGIDDEFLIYKAIYRTKTVSHISACLYYYCMTPESQMRSTQTLKSIDSVWATSEQIVFFHEHGLNNLANTMLYRHYAGVLYAYRFVREKYPNERELLEKLGKMKHTWWHALVVKDISVSDKCLLIMRACFPKLFYKLHSFLR